MSKIQLEFNPDMMKLKDVKQATESLRELLSRYHYLQKNGVSEKEMGEMLFDHIQVFLQTYEVV